MRRSRFVAVGFAALSSLVLSPLGVDAATSFTHVVVIVQENRTPDNLFQGLCGPAVSPAPTPTRIIIPPTGHGQPMVLPAFSPRCNTKPSASQYDILQSNWLDDAVSGGVVQPGVVPLANKYDLNHGHSGFVAMCDASTPKTCKMDGAAGVNCRGTCLPQPQFRYVDNSTGILNPYLQMARQYGWANYMFQTNQGPSFPAHQFLFGGTSAPSADDDAKGIFASENMTGTGGTGGSGVRAGCTAKKDTTVELISPAGETSKMYPCFEHQTMGDILTQSSVTWRYYSPRPGTIWTAPNAIKHICKSSGFEGTCMGPEWKRHLDFRKVGVLKDIAACKLRSVSWVIPTGKNSDHAKDNDGDGPAWVASIVNAIGKSDSCDAGKGYWKNTAIVITWDDWGGWYDHVVPPEVDKMGPGFRVPLLVVSPYARHGYVSHQFHEASGFGTFIEENFGLPSLGARDALSDDFADCFDYQQTPATYRSINTRVTADALIHEAPTGPPDDD